MKRKKDGTVPFSLLLAQNLGGAATYELVRVGHQKLVGEIIKLMGDVVVIQVYEDTVGLAVGDPVVRTGKPLSVDLGPGLLASVFDGIQRPLNEIKNETESAFIPRGIDLSPLNEGIRWHFKPVNHLKVGDNVAGGDIIGLVKENLLMHHKIMVPPGDMGEIVWIAERGDYTVTEPLLEIEFKGKKKKKIAMKQTWPVRTPRPFIEKTPSREPLFTGFRVIDALYPVVIGGTAAAPGSSGVGKTMLIGQTAKYSNSDVVVIVNCGERASELSRNLLDFPLMTTRSRSGREEPVMKKTVMVSNTSNMPVAGREASIHTGATIAEYYRDMGYNVSLTADSTSRWAEALREIGARLGGGMIGDRGFPADLGSKLASFYDRSGCVQCLGSPARSGALTITGTVSPPGGDFQDPVVQSTLALVQTFWALDIKLVRRRHFPSINWLLSFSKSQHLLEPFYDEIDPEFVELRRRCIGLLEAEEQLTETIELVGKDSLKDSDKVLLAVCSLIREDFLQQNLFTSYDRFCPLYKNRWMLRNLLKFHDLAQDAVQRDLAWETIKEETADLRYRLSSMRFQDPDDGQAALVAFYNALHDEISAVFRTIIAESL